MKRIPFSFTIKLPMPLKTGVDYGFVPGSNISKKGTGARKYRKSSR